jgi:hypothetical protein
MRISNWKIWIHVLGCIFFLSLAVLFSPDLNTDLDFLKAVGFWRDLTVFVIMLVFFYTSYYLLLPKFFFGEKYLLFGGGLLFFFLLFIFIPSTFFHEQFRQGESGQRIGGIAHRPFHPQNIFIRETRHYFFHFFIVLIFSFFLKIYDGWKTAEKQKAEAELSYLKAQVNPHFLFNTLNSIYSLALEKSDNTAPAIVKLSGLMRYVITESGKDFVLLEKEINYVRDFYDLQKIRLEDTIKMSLIVEGKANENKISPLLLIPFVENAFKYGVNPEENSEIIIKILLGRGKVELTVSNKKVRLNIPGDEKSGLGIKNTSDRLNLLYPAKHELRIINSDDIFNVYLRIDLNGWVDGWMNGGIDNTMNE